MNHNNYFQQSVYNQSPHKYNSFQNQYIGKQYQVLKPKNLSNLRKLPLVSKQLLNYSEQTSIQLQTKIFKQILYDKLIKKKYDANGKSINEIINKVLNELKILIQQGKNLNKMNNNVNIELDNIYIIFKEHIQDRLHKSGLQVLILKQSTKYDSQLEYLYREIVNDQNKRDKNMMNDNNKRIMNDNNNNKRMMNDNNKSMNDNNKRMMNDNNKNINDSNKRNMNDNNKRIDNDKGIMNNDDNRRIMDVDIWRSSINSNYECFDLFNSKDFEQQLKKFVEQLHQKYDSIKLIINQYIQNYQNINKNSNNKIQKIYAKTSYFYLKQLQRINLQYQLPKYPYYSYKLYQQNQNIMEIQFQKNIQSYTTPFKINFQKKNFNVLHPTNWLTTSIILNYVQSLKLQYRFNQPTSNCYILNQSQSQSMKNIKEFRQSFNFPHGLSQIEKIGMIINKSNIHWYFVGIFPKQRQIYIYDSIKNSDSQYDPIIRMIDAYFKQQAELNSRQYIRFRVIISGNCPLQQNGYDCGICVISCVTLFSLTNIEQKVYKKIDYEIKRLQTVRIGLHFLMCYLITRKMGKQSCYIQYDYIQYCVKRVLTSDDWRVLF